MAMSDLGFIDPTYVPGRAIIPMAHRPKRLAGMVIGFLDNTKEQADIIFETIGAALVKTHGAARVVVMRKEHYTKPASADLIDALAREAQVAIAGLGG
jgi:hypothetical protein